jgi:hypothetical protein
MAGRGRVRLRKGATGGALRAVEAVAAVITIAAVVVGLAHHFDSNDVARVPGEGRRIVAFRQVANRICTEHRGNLRRALAEAPNRIERLGFVSRAIGWDVNDLESITPPPSRASVFLAEVLVRRRAGPEVLALQQAIELHRLGDKATDIAKLEALEAQSRELSRSAGIVRCMRILPPISRLTSS